MLKIKSNSGEPTQNPARRTETPQGDALGARRVNCTHKNKNGSQGQLKPFGAVSLLMGAGDGQELGVPTSCTKNTTRPTRTKKAELQAPETLENCPWYTSAPRRDFCAEMSESRRGTNPATTRAKMSRFNRAGWR